MRFVCFGDSLTWGQYGGSYVDALSRMLPQFDLVNSGIEGDTVLNLSRRVENDVIAYAPDGVLMMVGGNDALSYHYPKIRPYYQHAKDIPDGYLTPDQFAKLYRDLLIRFQAAHIQTWAGLVPGEYSQDLNEVLSRFNSQARAAAISLNVTVIDIAAALDYGGVPMRPALSLEAIRIIGQRGRDGWRDYEAERLRSGYRYTFDGLHPTPMGAQRIAQIIAPFIQP